MILDIYPRIEEDYIEFHCIDNINPHQQMELNLMLNTSNLTFLGYQGLAVFPTVKDAREDGFSFYLKKDTSK